MAVDYRPAALDQAELASDLMTAAYPSLPHDPVMTRKRWQWGRTGFSVGRFLAWRGGAAIAFLAWMHGPWEKVPGRHCEVEVWLDRAALERELLREMWEWIGERAESEGAALLLAYAGEDEEMALDVLAALGYERARLEKVWELDLRLHGARLLKEAAVARERMDAAGIGITTLADWDDPHRLEKLHALSVETVEDVPHSLPIVPEHLEDFVKRVNAPDRPHDRFWIAVHDGKPVTMSYLKYPPVRGMVWTGFTATDRGHRGRGIARAVKLQTLAQAIRLGVPRVRTDNDSENAPMLRINEALGYVSCPGFVEHHKRVTSTGDG